MIRNTPAENEELTVQYQHYHGGERESIDLIMDYWQGTVVAITLLAVKKHNGNWTVLRATINEDETTAEPNEALESISELRWHVFPIKEHGRKMPPVVAMWEMGDLRVAACLSYKYSKERFAIRQQEEAPSTERRLCWWPDSESWELAKQIASHLTLRTTEVGGFLGTKTSPILSLTGIVFHLQGTTYKDWYSFPKPLTTKQSIDHISGSITSVS